MTDSAGKEPHAEPAARGSAERAAFRRGRHRDWLVVAACHVLAIALSVVVVLLLCSAHRTSAYLLFFPYDLYWTVTAVFAQSPGFGCFFLLGSLFFPIWIHRSYGYVKSGSTRSLARAGFRGRWVGDALGRRWVAAARFAAVPTFYLLRRARFARAFEAWQEDRTPRQFEPWRAVSPLPGRAASVILVSLLISLHHFAVLGAFESVFGAKPPWVLRLASWAGPCEFEWRGCR